MNRRHFIRTGIGATVGGLAIAHANALPNSQGGEVKANPIPVVRIGYVGVGGMGTNHVRNLTQIPGCEIKAVCDINEANAIRAQGIIEKAGSPKPELYTRGEHDFLRLCDRNDLDLVYTATPWEWHVPVCVAAMERGKHAATEVPAAVTIEECWKLVETSEKTNRYCVMMENCNYGREEMMVLNLVRQGLLGDLEHGECAYNHDLRATKLNTKGEGLWRWKHSVSRNGNLYPTHGLGPMAWYMNIGYGDQFDYLVSISSPAKGLNLWAKEHLPDSDPRKKIDFKGGDVNTSLVKTKTGLTIVITHDCNIPRPYTRVNLVQGTRGIFQGYPDRIYIEGRSPKEHEWEDAEAYLKEFEHPVWKAIGEQGKDASHGSMDYIEDFRLIRALHLGVEPDLNVYDAAAWSAVSELSEKSVAARSKPIDFPDFTRGSWKTRKPVELAVS